MARKGGGRGPRGEGEGRRERAERGLPCRRRRGRGGRDVRSAGAPLGGGGVELLWAGGAGGRAGVELLLLLLWAAWSSSSGRAGAGAAGGAAAARGREGARASGFDLGGKREWVGTKKTTKSF